MQQEAAAADKNNFSSEFVIREEEEEQLTRSLIFIFKHNRNQLYNKKNFFSLL